MGLHHHKPTQVSFGNFPGDVRATELAEFLELKLGAVERCKVKKVTGGVPPHAFVHFESPKVAQEAVKRASLGRLVFRQIWTLEARMDDRSWAAGRRGFNSKIFSHIQLTEVILEVGSIIEPQSMLIGWRGPKKGSFFRIEPVGRRLRFFFSHYFLQLGRESNKIACDVMLEICLHEVRLVREIEREVDPVLLIQLSSPPWIFYRTADDDIYESQRDPTRLADDEDPWTRCLDIITPNQSIGRCLDYRLTVSPRQRTAFMKVVAYFRNHNILQKSMQAAYALSVEDSTNSSDGHFFTVPNLKDIPFELMILVNALVHRGIVHPSNLSKSFYNLVKPNESTSLEAVTFALRQMLAYNSPVFQPTEELRSIVQWVLNDANLVKEPELSGRNMVVRRLIITPTRAICLPPEVELSNRVLRHFKRLADRFLRVSFLDEDAQSIPSGSLTVQVAPIVRALSSVTYERTTLFQRVVAIMNEGFCLCGREYHVLAYSSGQLRDASAWFYAGDGFIGANDIREWMGEFPKQNVAKFAARMGQCFSSTYSTKTVSNSEVFELEDIKRNGYDFSDGCGKISPEFAKLVADILELSDNPPSAYQIRYAGYKGVVAVWPIEPSSGKTYKLALRDSMNKFRSYHRDLEIVGWSKFLPSYLNRQIITLLSTLNVPDYVFIELQDAMVRNLNRMVVDRDLAYSVLRVSCAGELYSTALRMLYAGFDPLSEAYLKSMLVAIRAGQLEELVQKSKIFVPKGRWLMGCLDETATLEYGQCFVQVSTPGDKGDKLTTKVVTGPLIMAKNPCMHPGDVRLLWGVDNPDLHHMKDCLVVPQNGPRPHPNEASGSDLDGDVYFVSWDENLIPPSRQSWAPMEYEASVAREFRGNVKIEHVVEFFAKHMVNDNLGKISNAHVVIADKSPEGALDRDCLFLAELAAQAVDFPKTGKPAVMPFDLKPREYPDFMEKDPNITYRSSKVIGRLFRSVKTIISEEMESSPSEFSIPEPAYDPDLEVAGFEAFLEKAWATKQSYDQQLQAIMAQFNIANEGEVVTGNVVLGAKTNSRRQGDVKERAAFAYRALYKQYSLLISPPYNAEEQKQDCDEFHAIVSDEVLQAQASAWYHVTYHHDWYQKSQDINPNRRPFLSFAWVAVDLLIAIKSKKKSSTEKICPNSTFSQVQDLEDRLLRTPFL